MKIVKHDDATADDIAHHFAATFSQLKSILSVYAGPMLVRYDSDTVYSVYTPALKEGGKQMLFGRVKIQDFCVRYDLDGLDIYPELFMTISPDLRKRMHGTSSFIFTELADRDVEKLEQLTQRCFDKLRTSGIVEKKVA